MGVGHIEFEPLKTLYLSESSHDVAIAADLLRRGELVAFPTETVYGLGAIATDARAIERIFQAKGRPTDNPLIVHLASENQVHEVATYIDPIAFELMHSFWPGPLTLVLEKRDRIPGIVTCGLTTVAVRMPNHPTALQLIQSAALPVAAPSANLSGRPSATTWQAAAEDLDGKVAAIICGKPCIYGLESTVVDVASHPFRILRPGGVSLEALQARYAKIIPYSQNSTDPSTTLANSPGLRHRHYQPKAKVMLVDRRKGNLDPPLESLSSESYYLGLQPPNSSATFRKVVLCESVESYAAQLFDVFRQADADNARVILCESVSEVGIGAALMDRLRRAAS